MKTKKSYEKDTNKKDHVSETPLDVGAGSPVLKKPYGSGSSDNDF